MSQNTDFLSTVRSIDDRVSGVERVLYGDDRTNDIGLVREVRQLAKMQARQIAVVWGLIVLSVLNTITIAFAVLMP